jgi:hypothetical protein
MGDKSGGRRVLVAVVVVVVVGGWALARLITGDSGSEFGAGCGTEPSVEVVSHSTEVLPQPVVDDAPLVDFEVEMKVTNDTPVPVYVMFAEAYALDNDAMVSGSASETLDPGASVTVSGRTMVEAFGGVMPSPDPDRVEVYWEFADAEDGFGCDA